jgi:hypothetical protein
MMSIKVTLFFFLFSLTFAQAQGQPPTPDVKYPERIISRYELMIGSNLIYPGGSRFTRQLREPKFGLRTAIGFVHEFEGNLDLDLKISYENKGYIFEVYSETPEPPPTDKHVFDVTLNYVTATLLARYTIVDQSRIEVGLGPYLGYLVSTKQVQKSYYQGDLVTKHRSRPDPDDSYEVFDFGFSFIICGNLAIRENRGLTLQFLYTRGITDVNKPQSDQILNNTFSLLIGFYSRNKN